MKKTLKQFGKEVKDMADRVPDVKLPKPRTKPMQKKTRMGSRRGD